MAEESSVSEVAEREVPVANGGVPHKSSGPGTEKKDNESNRVDKMEVDCKDEKRADPEEEDAEAKVDMEEKKEEEPKDVTKQEDNNGDKEEKEEDAPESAAMDLDKDGREDKKKEEPEKAAVEEKSVLEVGEDTNKNNDEIEGSKEIQEKVDGLDKELEKARESREKNEEKNLEEDIEKNDEEMAEERNEKKDEEHKENEEDEEGEEKAEEIKEEKADKEQPGENKEDKGSKKGRSRKNAAGKVREKKKLKQEVEQRTPVTDRPVRERKSVERLVATIEKDANKEIHIEKGRGTPLKDIPNVAYKLARRKPDDTFKLLHSVMFGRRVKAFQIRGNISRFSGFVWHDDEEKQRSKVKEKFDKSTKEKLLEVCDILDIPIAKATTRKEDIIVKLIDFLVAPHATTPVLLAEKESGKGQKRKRGMKRSSSTPRSGSSNRAAKSRTKGGKKASSDSDDNSEDEKEEEEHGTDEEKTVNGVSEESDHGKQDQFESEEESSSEDESGEDSGKKKKQKSSSKKQSAGRAKSNKIEGSEMTSPPPKTTKRSSAKRSKVDNDSEVSPTPRKKNDSGVKKASAKSASKERTVRKTSKGKDKAKDEKAGPSIDELRDAICEILKEVDFNTATFTDILKQLAKKFDTDLTPRKSAIKLMIQEELTKLADEADDEEDTDGGAGKDEMAVDGTEVKA